MNLPQLYSLNNSCVVNSISHVFKKHTNLVKLKNKSSILEIGTGDGRTTSEILLPLLPEDSKEIVLSDKSEVMLEPAKKLDYFAKFKFAQLDIEGETVPEDFKNRFDYVFSLFTFHWLKKSGTRQALNNIYEMLKPGGEIFCVFFTQQPGDSAWDTLSKHPKWSKYNSTPFISPYYRNPNIVDIYYDYLTKCGFENCLVDREDYYYDFETEKEFIDLSTSVNVNVKVIPNELKDDYTQDFLTYLKKDDSWTFEKSVDGQQLIRSRMPLVFLHAQKPDDTILH